MEFNATFIVSVISFIVFVFIMNKILYKPICDVMEQRQNYLENNENEVKNNQDKAQTFLTKRENELISAHQKSKDITVSGLNKAKLKKTEIIEDTKKLTKQEQERKLKEIEQEKISVENDMKKSAEDLSKSIISKLFGGDNV